VLEQQLFLRTVQREVEKYRRDLSDVKAQQDAAVLKGRDRR
jgi:hypothetical protein